MSADDSARAARLRLDTPSGRRTGAGFTLVEVIIAIVVLAVGVLGLAGTTGYLVRQVNLANQMTQRAVALQTVIERVQAMPFADLADGTDSVGGFAVQWTTAVETVRSRMVTVVTRGPGLKTSSSFPVLAPDVPDTFVFRRIQ